MNKLKIALDARDGGERNGSPGVLEAGAVRLTPGTPMLFILLKGPGMERRKHPRVRIDLPICYHIRLPDSGQSFAGTGVLKNISQGGMFLKCPPPLPINDGGIGNFTIDTRPIIQHISRLRALGKVVRLELLEENFFDFGITVQFLSGLNVELLR
jgi:hypothetical protein